MNFLKKNKFSIFVFIVVFIVFIISDNEVETNSEAIEESFKWGRAIIIGIVVGGCNLLNHYFFNDKN